MNVCLLVGACEGVDDDVRMVIIYNLPCDVSALAVSRNPKS